MSFLSELAVMTPTERDQLVADLVSEREQERDIDRAIRQLETRLRIRRIATLLPPEAADLPPSLPPGIASGGAFHQELTP